MGTPGVLPPFTAIGLGTPTAIANAYNSGIPSLGAFALASSGALNTTTNMRGLSNVLLVSNLNEEVNTHTHKIFSLSFFHFQKIFPKILAYKNI